MPKRRILLSILIVMLCLAPVGAQAQAKPAKPNILVILVDDMGYGDLSCFGSKQIQTPNLDALAASGVRCTQGYTASSVCAPSRAGLMTGRYPNRFGFEHNLAYPDFLEPEQVGIPKGETLLPEYLQDAGYQTACIGKWHLGQHAPWHMPNNRGFDYFFGMLKGNHSYFPKADKNELSRDDQPVTQIDVPYLTDWFTVEAIDYVKDADRDRPWFLYLSYNTPHTPMQAKQEDIDRFAHIKDNKRRIYCAMQHCLDQNVGKLMACLKSTGQLENTLVVFLSDNGGPCISNASINAPLRGQKGAFLEGGVRVPYIFSWPGVLPAGKVYERPFIALDLLPTFLSAAKIDRPAADDRARPLDGVDLLPYLMGKRQGQAPHEVLFWRISQRSAAVRIGDMKLIRQPSRMPTLYDLGSDVSELDDLAARQPDQANAMLQRLFEWETSFKQVPIWESGVNWMKHHEALYRRDYQLTQPAE